MAGTSYTDVYNSIADGINAQNTGSSLDTVGITNPTGINNPADYIFNMEEFSKDLSSALDTKGHIYGKVYGGDAANERKKNRSKKRWENVAKTAAFTPFGITGLIGGIGSAATDSDAKSKAYFSDYIKRYLPDAADQRDFYNRIFNVIMEKGNSITRADIERIQNDFIASGKAEKDFDLSGGRVYDSFIRTLKAAVPNMQQKYNKKTGFVKSDEQPKDTVPGGVAPGGVVPPSNVTGRQVDNTNMAVAAANPGDWIIRSNGQKVVLNSGDIAWAKQYIAKGKKTVTGNGAAPADKVPTGKSLADTIVNETSAANNVTSNHGKPYAKQPINGFERNAFPHEGGRR